jgi:hypothetical protein
MPNYILTNKSVILCPHGGMVTNLGGSAKRPVIDGGFPMLINDHFVVGGCASCNTVNWANPSMNYRVNGVPALTTQSIGLCSGIQGIGTGNTRVALCQTKVEDKQGNLNFAK